MCMFCYQLCIVSFFLNSLKFIFFTIFEYIIKDFCVILYYYEKQIISLSLTKRTDVINKRLFNHEF